MIILIDEIILIGEIIILLNQNKYIIFILKFFFCKYGYKLAFVS